MPEYLLHGMRVRSPFALSADRYVEVDARDERSPAFPVVTVRLVPELSPHCNPAPDAELLLRWLEPNDLPEDIVTLHRLGGPSTGWLFSYAGIRFWLNETLDEVQVVMRPDDDAEWVQVLFEGWLVSILVMLRGGLVLHASSVLLDSQLVVFVGNSGQGKSTLAAHLCASGGQLFSDDVLSVKVSIEPQAGLQRSAAVWCDLGSNSVRLRKDAAEHAALQDLGTFTVTDDRAVCRFTRSVPPVASASTIIIPSVSATEGWSVRTLSPADAARELLRYPRTFHWLQREHQIRTFDAAAAIASLIPVSVLTVPKGAMDSDTLRSMVNQILQKQLDS
jgi:hypothetical protein